jgi:Domain of unknown function (DUF3943)
VLSELWPLRVATRALLAIVLTAPAVAQGEAAEEEADETFRYRATQSQHYGRAALEELLVLGGEGLQYWKDRSINSEDWDLDYDWRSFRGKLDGTAYSFDTNRFTTNFAYHPAAGTLYYLAPRGNRLNVLESLAYATAASTFWEVFAEFRELVSINDMWVTPLSGLAFGETTTQLGAFFDRGCASRVNQALGWLFGPARSLHDAVDGAELARAPSCDEWGFDTASTHRFVLAAGGAEVQASDGTWYGVSRGRLETSIINLPVTRDGWRGFSDGNVSDLVLGLAYGPRDIQDLLIEARTTIAGAQYRRRVVGPKALGFGDRLLFGVTVGTQYSLHRYRTEDAPDSVFLIDAPAVTMRWSGRRPGYGFHVAFDVGATFGGMDALALELYRETHSDEGLTTIARQQRYNYVVGVALVPQLRLELNGAEIGVQGRSERVVGIRALDRYDRATASVPVTEQRRRAQLWLALGPPKGVRLSFQLELGDRRGAVGDTHRTLSDWALGSSLGFVL